MPHREHTPAGLPPGLSAVIVLAGGTARRLGGISKPDLEINGMTLLSRSLREIERVAPEATVVVAAPPEVTVPATVLRVLEDPPLGGPLAGVAAGFRAIADSLVPDALVGLLTCDAPLAPRLYPACIDAIRGTHTAGAAPLFGDDGHVQYLHGVYRASVLAGLLRAPSRDRSVRSAFRALAISHVPDTRMVGMDIDTWEDATIFSHLLHTLEAG